jgi:hypothetical protein
VWPETEGRPDERLSDRFERALNSFHDAPENTDPVSGARPNRSWRWFAAWMAPGVCLALGVTALGVFALPVGVVLILVLSRRGATVDALGALAGLGAIVAWLGSLNLNYQACSSHATRVTLTPGGAQSISYSCGGINGMPWLIIGIGIAAVAICLYILMTSEIRPRRGKRAPHDSTGESLA